MIGIAVLVALVGVLAAVGFFLSARGARAALTAQRGEAERLRAESEAARKAASELKAESRERREEAATLRTELGQVRKKAFEQQEAQKKLGGAAALREEIDKLAARLAEARAEAEHQAARTRTLEKELEKTSQAAERARVAAERRAAEPAPVAAAPAPVAAPAPAPVDDGRLQAEKERADKAETKLADVKKRVLELERDLKNVRGRLETEKRVYMVQKGELELAADRYAELRRRHEALRKDHDELVDAVRQAAREERRLTQAEAARAETPANEKAEGAA